MNGKISPELLAMREEYREFGFRQWMHFRGLYKSHRDDMPDRATVFLICNDNDVTFSPDDERFSSLEYYHIEVNRGTGRIRTAFLPLNSLEYLAEYPEVDYIVPSYRLRFLLDEAVTRIGLASFWKNTGMMGQNVIIGIIDSGIDADHPAFANRILSIWDQTVTGGPGVSAGGYKYGEEFTGHEMLRSMDQIGHGTHVAGIAAGNIHPYCGAAPEAFLVIVKTDLDETHITDGIRYIFEIADQLCLPAVINISIGGHYDPHDGKDPLSISIDDATDEGRIICCAAGNEGNKNIHARAVVADGKQEIIQFELPGNMRHRPDKYAELYCWYSGDDQIDVAVESPTGTCTSFHSVNSNRPQIEYFDGAKVKIVADPKYHPGRDRKVSIKISSYPGSSQPIRTGSWRLILNGYQISGSGQFDAWVIDSYEEFDVIFTGSHHLDSIKIGSPGSANSAITVASYTTKTAWTDVGGYTQTDGLTLYEISDFSSNGPLRNNFKKPDVAAPGAWLVSSLSSHCSPNSKRIIDRHHMVMYGTSLSTPIISGIVACLLQRNPNLDPDTVKTILRDNSFINAQRSNFDPKWGYGLIEASGL